MDWEYYEYYECREAHNGIQNAKFKIQNEVFTFG